jgi:hypothetical protein
VRYLNNWLRFIEAYHKTPVNDEIERCNHEIAMIASLLKTHFGDKVEKPEPLTTLHRD